MADQLAELLILEFVLKWTNISDNGYHYIHKNIDFSQLSYSAATCYFL